MISFVDGYYGWLGNQMFQYAATKALSLHLGVKCGWPAQNKPNLFDIFNLNAVRAGGIVFGTLYTREAREFAFDETFFDLPDGTVLYGYFQSERYFKPYAEQIRREFTFRMSGVQPPIEYRPVHTEDCRERVSIHVRRGDYLSFPDHHPPLTMDYYREAMSRFPGARFLVFSDDPGWCLLNFRDSGYDVQISTGRTAAEDMALMASCDHHIIANSSFSWWGAWLGRNPDKRVIAPVKWFGPAKAGWDTKDLIPKGWERL